MKAIENIKFFVESKLSLYKLELKNKLTALKQDLVVNHALPLVADYMRKLIIAQGKDPDYVAPVPPQEPVKSDIQYTGMWELPYLPTWAKDSFKDPSKHPVNISRAKIKEEYPKGTLPRSISEAYAFIDDRDDDEKVLNMLGVDASTVSTIASKKKTKKSKKVSSAKKSKKAAKSFKGFRRVSE